MKTLTSQSRPHQRNKSKRCFLFHITSLVTVNPPPFCSLRCFLRDWTISSEIRLRLTHFSRTSRLSHNYTHRSVNVFQTLTCGKARPSMTAINEIRLPSLSLNTSANSMSLLSTFSLVPKSPAATTKVATQ